MLTTVRCLVAGLGVKVRVRFSDWLVSGYAHVFILLSIVIVTVPFHLDDDDNDDNNNNYYYYYNHNNLFVSMPLAGRSGIMR